MNTQQLARIWEVFAHVRSTPADAVAALERHNGITVTEDEAQRQIEAAKGRNTLRLITWRPGYMRSNWGCRQKAL